VPSLVPNWPCENFLYGFKAARRAARAAATAPWPSLSLALRSAGPVPVGWREKEAGPLYIQQVSSVRADRPCSRRRIVRARPEPVKAVCDRRATAPVELPGERTHEAVLDRTCPDQEMAAIGSRDTGGPGP
jgi:hypothetical protein